MLGKLVRAVASSIEEARIEAGLKPAQSQARLLKAGVDIPAICKAMKERDKHAPSRATDVGIRMKDGMPMQFYNDGSLRHMFGKPGKAGRRALKKARRLARKTNQTATKE